jgi:HAD superfamily hydrolase (TIGR01509 family)
MFGPGGLALRAVSSPPGAPSPYELVIFDTDGVLVDSERLANRVLADLLTEHGWPRTTEQCVAAFADTGVRGGTLARVRDAFARATFRDLPGAFDVAYQERLFAAFRTGLATISGVRAVLDRLDALGLPFCLASSGTSDRIVATLDSIGLLPRFAGRIFSAEAVGRPKPAPDLYLYVARTLGADPTRCAVVEDSAAGVDAARAAGMTVFGYTAVSPPARLGGAHALFACMDDLPDLLTRTA